jgi:hypothetical protein
MRRYLRRMTSPPRLWDISPPVYVGAPVFPGDTPYQQTWAATIGPQCPVNVSELTLSPHVGAHADAPLHYAPDGASIGHTDLTPYLGPCRVIHAIDCGPLIEWPHIAHAVGAGLPPRVLVRTYARAPVDHWDPALSAYAPAASTRPASTRPTARRWTATRSSAGSTCACSRTSCSTTCPRATTNSSRCRSSSRWPMPHPCAPCCARSES